MKIRLVKQLSGALLFSGLLVVAGCGGAEVSGESNSQDAVESELSGDEGAEMAEVLAAGVEKSFSAHAATWYFTAKRTTKCGSYRYLTTFRYHTDEDFHYAWPDSLNVTQEDASGNESRKIDYRVQQKTHPGSKYVVHWDSKDRHTRWASFEFDTTESGSKYWPGTGRQESDRPYIRISAGKDGDGRKNCVYTIAY